MLHVDAPSGLKKGNKALSKGRMPLDVTPLNVSRLHPPASFCPQLPLETGDAFGETGVERSQHHHLVFDVLEFVLIERTLPLFADRKRVRGTGASSASETLF